MFPVVRAEVQQRVYHTWRRLTRISSIRSVLLTVRFEGSAVTVRRRARWCAVLAVLATTATVGAGCTGGAQPRSGTAAEVGDTSISVSALQERVRALQGLSPDTEFTDQQAASNQRSMLGAMVMAELQGEYVARENIEVSDKAVEAQVKNIRSQLKQGGQSLPSDLVERIAREGTLHSTVLESFASEVSRSGGDQGDILKAYSEAMRSVAKDLGGIEINPRYGAWNPETTFLRSDPLIKPAGGQLVDIQRSAPPQQQIGG